MPALTDQSVQTELKNLKEWQFIGNAIEKKFKFPDFVHAMGFMVQLGLLAEKRNHHPEIFNVYNKITIRLTTHDSSGVTIKDIELASAIDKLMV